MSSNEKNIPKRRFKEFIKSEAWEELKLGDIVKLNGRIGFRGYTEKDIISKSEGGVLTFSPTNIVDNRLTTSCKNTYITRFKYDESPEIKIKNGDILFVKTGSTLGKSALVKGINEDATLNPQVIVLRVEKSTEEFVSIMLTTDLVLKQVATSKIGGAVPTLTETKIKEFLIVQPKKVAEQIKIGTYFKQLDNLITLHQRKLDKLKVLKKAYLAQMFPPVGESKPRLRFSGFNDDWEKRKLGEYCDMYNGDRGINYPNEKDMVSVGIPFVNAGDLKNGRVDLCTSNKITKEKYSKLGGAKLQHGDILYCLRGTIGKNAFIDNFNEGTVASSLIALRPKNIDGKYLFHILNSNIELRQRIVCDEGAAQPNLSAKNLAEFDIPVPKIEEQIVISKYLDKLDNLITFHQRKLEKLQNIKKAYLNEMFV